MYFKCYKKIGLNVYDFMYYNKLGEKYLLSYYKNELKKELDNNQYIQEDEFINKDNKKKLLLSQLRLIVDSKYDFNYFIKNKLFSNEIKIKALEPIIFINKLNKHNNIISNILKFKNTKLNKIILKIEFNCFKLTDKLLYNLIKELKIIIKINRYEYYNKNLLNILFENNKSYVINYEKKYLEFQLIKPVLHTDLLYYSEKEIIIDFGKFTDWNLFKLDFDETYNNTNCSGYEQYVTYIKNYNNIESLLKKENYSFGFIIYTNNVDYTIDIKNIIIKNIEVNFDIFYIGDIKFYIVYFNNTITDINDFIDKIYNIKKTNTYVALNLKDLNKDDIKINFYNYDKNYNDKICISNIDLNAQRFIGGCMVNILSN